MQKFIINEIANFLNKDRISPYLTNRDRRVQRRFPGAEETAWDSLLGLCPSRSLRLGQAPFPL